MIRFVHPVPRRFRLRKTLRQLLPASPYHIIFLLAAAILSACFGRSWLFLPSKEALDAIGPLSNADIRHWVLLTQLFASPLLIAGVGAYFCCLFRRERVAASWWGLVIAPTIVGIAGALIAPALIVLNERPGSIFEKHNRQLLSGFRLPLRGLVLNTGNGFRLAVLGLLIALLAAWLLRKGAVSLPAHFGPPVLPVASEDTNANISRLKIFAIYALALFGLGGGILSLLLSPICIWFPRSGSYQMSQTFGAWFYAGQYLMYAVPFFLLAVWALGKNRRAQLLASARLPSIGILGLAVVLPIAVHWLPHLIAYAGDRVAWAQHWSDASDAPQAAWYLHIPPIGLDFVLFALAAGLSEWCWRGCIQPQLIRTFGLFRGIFLVGILYGSSQQLQFPAPFGPLPDFFLHFVLQLLWGIVWSVILGWLALAAGSVWPSVVCAALSSVLAHATMIDRLDLIPRQYFRLCMLGMGCVVAVLLVRYLPLPKNAISTSESIVQTS